jgi:hypothetical protein
MCVLLLKAQTEPLKTATAKTSQKPDLRYAILKGAWSAATISLFNTWSAFDDNPGRRASFYSPDHKKLIEVVGSEAFLRMGGKSFKTDINNETNHDAELGWAPDSTRFFVTWSDGGEQGGWHMQVYGLDASGVHEIPGIAEPARKDFELFVRKLPIDPTMDNPNMRSLWDSQDYCEPYNVVGGRWLNGSRQLLLSVLVPNTSACRYTTLFDVYRVDAVTGKILQRYAAAEGHKLFGDEYLPRIVF